MKLLPRLCCIMSYAFCEGFNIWSAELLPMHPVCCSLLSTYILYIYIYIYILSCVGVDFMIHYKDWYTAPLIRSQCVGRDKSGVELTFHIFFYIPT